MPGGGRCGKLGTQACENRAERREEGEGSGREWECLARQTTEPSRGSVHSRAHLEPEEKGRRLGLGMEGQWGQEGGRVPNKEDTPVVRWTKTSAPFNSHTVYTGEWAHFILSPALPNGSSNPTRLSAGNLRGIYIPLHSQACQRKQCYSKDSGDTSAYFTECLALDALQSLWTDLVSNCRHVNRKQKCSRQNF